MNNPETEGQHDEHRESDRRFDLTLTKSQRDAMLIAIASEINASENEIQAMKAKGLNDGQTIEDYNLVADLITRLETIQSLLKDS